MAKKKKEKFDPKKFFKKNLKFILIGAIAVILLRNYVLPLILCCALGFVGMESLKVSRMTPHISVETVSGSAILIGYLYGWQWGLGFGMIVGNVGYAKISLLKHTTIVSALFMGMCGVLASVGRTMGLSFFWSFFLTFVIRANIGYVVFSGLNPDKVENIMHSYGDALFSVLIVYQLMNIIYSILG